jgi:hypothetical protein
MIWKIEEECLVPERQIRLEYAGVNPLRVYRVAKDLAIRLLEVLPFDVWERDFRWGAEAEPHPFFVRLYIRKRIDDKSYLFIETIFEGVQPSDITKPGKVSILISGRLVTEYWLDRWWKRPPFFPFYKAVILAYHAMFYDEVRARYMRTCNEWLTSLWREFRVTLGIPASTEI